MAHQQQADIMFTQFNEAIQMICVDVYSQFASTKLFNVVKLSEKYKLMTTRCILKSGLIS